MSDSARRRAARAVARIRHPSSPPVRALPSTRSGWMPGPDATTGWSWVGNGRARRRPERVRARRVRRSPAADRLAGRAIPRRVGGLARLRARRGARRGAGGGADRDVPPSCGCAWSASSRSTTPPAARGRSRPPTDAADSRARSTASRRAAAVRRRRLRRRRRSARHRPPSTPRSSSDAATRSARAMRISSASRRGSRSRHPSIPVAAYRRLRADDPGPPRRAHPLGRRRARQREPGAVPRGRGRHRADASDQGHAPARGGCRPTTRRWPPSCARARRSAPRTS